MPPVLEAREQAYALCGRCRQVLAELGHYISVIMMGPDGGVPRGTTLRELVPDDFYPET